MSCAARSLAIEIEQRRETGRFAADNRKRKRQAQHAGADDGLRCAANRDPDRQFVLIGARIDATVADGRPVVARPRHTLTLPKSEKQVKLLGEELVIVGEVVTEQREGFDEGPSPGHDLRTPPGKQIERCELLEDADRIVRGKYGDGACELDAFRALGGGSERHDRRRGRVVRAVMLAKPKDIEPDLVGKFDLFNQIAQSLTWTDRVRTRCEADIRKCVKAEFHDAVLNDLSPKR